MEHRLEERKYLNAQIINHQKLIFQIVTFSVIASVGIISWGLQTFPGNGTDVQGFAPFILLAPMAVIIPCVLIISGIREEIFRWGAYIILFHETGDNIGYETLLDKMRNKAGTFRESFTSLFAVYWVFWVICSVLFVLAVMSSDATPNGWVALIVVPLVLLIIWNIIFCRIPSKTSRERYRQDWLDAKKESEPEV